MEIVMGILVIVVAILTILLLGMKNKYRELQSKYQKDDKMLTKYVADNLDMEKKLSDMEEDYLKQQEMAKEINKIQEQMRLLKHDMKNHTLVIANYLESGKIEDAKQYVSSILDKLNKMYTYVNVGNALLNYIINTKLSKAKELGVEIKAEIENLTFAYIDSMEFSALLNNLLDNAIEAAITSDRKQIDIKILSQKGFDTIQVKNSIDKSVLANNPKFNTTKSESGHGYGIKQIKSIVEKYDGMMDIDEDDGMFIVSIMFNEQ